MGIGTDTAKQLLAGTTDRAEIAACVDALNEALHAIDTAEPVALEALKTAHAADYEQARPLEVAKRLGELTERTEKPPAEPVKAR